MIITGFELLESSLKQRQLEKAVTPLAQTQASRQAALNEQHKSSGSGEGPLAKKNKPETFAVNDIVDYFDTRVRSVRRATVLKVLGPSSAKIVNEDNNCFAINTKLLTKIEEWVFHPKDFLLYCSLKLKPDTM